MGGDSTTWVRNSVTSTGPKISTVVPYSLSVVVIKTGRPKPGPSGIDIFGGLAAIREEAYTSKMLDRIMAVKVFLFRALTMHF
jgi:hypothetical protein